MFRQQKRVKQILSTEECERILKNATSGVLALLGDGGYPYALPMSYVYNDNKIYFHCGISGHKIDAIRACNKASFCVIGQDEVHAEQYTTYFKSVILFGKIKVLDNADDIAEPIRLLAERYNPAGEEKEMQKEIDKWGDGLYMLEFKIEHMSGKQSSKLIN